MTGEELRAIRKSLGLNQTNFGKELDFTQTYVGQLERGERPINRRTELAAHYLNLTLRNYA